MILYRMSSNRDPGARPNDCLSMKEHTALLQEKNLLDLPKLLDICAIYGHENEELTKSLVANAIKAQPKILNKIDEVVSHFLNILHTMHQRCCSSLKVLVSAGKHEIHGYSQLYKEFLEVMDFVNDAVVTLDAFAGAYKPASFYFSLSFEMSYGNEDLLRTLARLHDSLLPSLQKGFEIVSSAKVDAASAISNSMLRDTLISLRMLSARIVKFGWKLLNYCYLNDKFIEDSLHPSSKMFPANVEDPVIRGDIIVQMFKEINGEISYNFAENHGNGTFLQKLEKEFKILNHIDNLRSNGWFLMDEQQFQYLSQIASPPHMKSWETESVIPSSSLNEKVQMDEDTVIVESKISQIKDLFPDYGRGFLSACLEVYNQDPEEVIQRILEGTLHEDLLSLDTSLEQIPPRKRASSQNDKGKGLLLESEPQDTIRSESQRTIPSMIMNPTTEKRVENGPASSSVSATSGRYTRKSNDDVADSAILDSKAAKDAARTAVLAAEYEYEDEYDDSFDDLGLSVVESVTEETENFTNKIKSSPAISSESSSNSGSKWSSQKKTQFYVKDGKNYSYKVSGSIAVSSAQDAALVNQAQKEMIHGLGRGGNLPLGAVKRLTDTEEQYNQIPDAAENSGRGNSNFQRGRGRRGGGNHHRKDRAMKKHMSGLGGH
ncbi:activating signal cointegrator 1 complex subunit 2 [Canna indica]|uniref:Activating signal cointegrator 1 complex subunit 2 n=1 Tax=Canna indica TaxID=4628 RepID=A0AAQ3Q0H4_9LILI|nr:activating signal cointegrator 1 complex subunit 2 [Canna indica]